MQHLIDSFLQTELDKLNKEQKKAALHKEGPLLVLAGAGSGKTKVVVTRIAALIAQGVDPYNILGVTFTNKAAQEMKERVSSLIGKSVLISTFHSLGVRILRESIDRLGFSRQFIIYDADDSLKLIKTLSKELYGPDEKIDAKELQSLFSSIKNNLERAIPPNIESIYNLYKKRLFELQAVDFDDLLFLPTLLFQRHPDVLEYYQDRWHYMLVDEYQDTNHAQYEFVRLLVQKRKNLFVVGDPDQSIYSWRGASIRNILDFEQDYRDATIIKLEQNYRSTRTILSAANAVIKNNDSRYEKALWSAHDEGEKISLFQARSERLEAHFVAHMVRQIRSLHGIPLSDIAIFYRTNFQSRPFEDLLLSQKIPYTIIGGLSFYQRKEIKDILAYLRLLENPNDLISFLRVINMPKRGFGEQFLTKLTAYAQREAIPIMHLLRSPPPSEIRTSAKQKAGWQEFATLYHNLLQAKEKKPLSELVRDVITQSGYLSIIDLDKETREERRENVAELIAKAAEWEDMQIQDMQIQDMQEAENPEKEPSLSRFLEELTLTTSLDSLEENNSDRLSLMTAHNGKGLEFQIVFLVGLEEELFPHINSKHSPDSLEEERRLFYVGITRAKKKLFLTYTTQRHLWGGLRHMRPSRFLHEIPFELRKIIKQ